MCFGLLKIAGGKQEDGSNIIISSRPPQALSGRLADGSLVWDRGEVSAHQGLIRPGGADGIGTLSNHTHTHTGTPKQHSPLLFLRILYINKIYKQLFL